MEEGGCELDFGDGDRVGVNVEVEGAADSSGALTGDVRVLFSDRGEVFWVEDFGYLASESNADGSSAFVKMYGEKEYEDRGDRFSIGFLFTMNATK